MTVPATPPHDSATTHVTGESEFIADRPFLQGELLVGVFCSPHAKARINRVDVSRANTLPGIAGVYTADDFVHNLWGTIFQDQPLLAKDQVNYVGEAIAVVAGESQAQVDAALRNIQVDYTLETPTLSITDAKSANLFIGSERVIEHGDVETALKHSPRRLSGKVVLRGADHFYLESQAVIAYPVEGEQLEIHSSTQHPSEVQHVIAHSLGLALTDVVCIVKRMGGGFGGKESQASPFGAYAALVAHRLKRPARLILTKDDDMVMTGKRNPFENDYTVGFDGQGRIHALKVELFSDGGAYADLSTAIMERAMLHCDNAYFLPAARITGRVCRTNFHPHTAFRGFGGPKGVATIEKIIELIGHAVKKDPLEIRKLNVYSEVGHRNTTPYGQRVENNCLPTLFAQLEKDCAYDRRRTAIAHANRGATVLHGLSMTAVKFGIAFTTRFLNQGNALILVHRDGTVQISTGATEMGQGVNARIAQVVAEELGIALSSVRVLPTRTDKNANTSPTAASSGTDLNAAAALIATRKIKSRLSQLAKHVLGLPEDRRAARCAPLGTEPEFEISGSDDAQGEGAHFESGEVFATAHPEKRIAFGDLVNEAYLNRIQLSEYAHFRTPGLSYNKLTGRGNAFLYFTQGVAASEVTVNTRTGETKVVRVDILMDLGRPINEGLDLGQVSGGFVQGMGWVTTENLFYSKVGKLLSHSPSTYKIPSVQDTPRVFNLKLLPNAGNTVNVRGTKAVGEPPLLLALSVWTAVHNALSYHPRFAADYPDLPLPATPEVVLRAIHPEHFKQWDLHDEKKS